MESCTAQCGLGRCVEVVELPVRIREEPYLSPADLFQPGARAASLLPEGVGIEPRQAPVSQSVGPYLHDPGVEVAQGHRVESSDHLRELLAHCRDTPGVHLIDCPVDYTENDRILNHDIKELSAKL